VARLYANENFPLPAVLTLRELGHDVQTSHDAGRANRRIADEDVLQYATSQDRAVLTINRKHFVRLHQTTPAHSGIIVCTFDPDFAAQARRIDATVQSLDSLAGRLVRVNGA